MTRKITKKQHEKPEFVSICDEHFGRISHYSDRKTIWIKLYLDLLDDISFCLLSDEMKFHFIGLMMQATKSNNKLPNNPNFLMQKLSATSQIDIDFLLEKELLIPFKSLKRKGKSDSKQLSSGYQAASLDKDKDKDEDKEQEENTDTEASVWNPLKSVHSFEVCREYTLALIKAGKDDIRSIDAYAASLHKTGSANRSIDEWITSGVVDYEKTKTSTGVAIGLALLEKYRREEAENLNSN